VAIIVIFISTASTAVGSFSPSSFAPCGQIHEHSENINAIR
jgi:hypothetical protein